MGRKRRKASLAAAWRSFLKRSRLRSSDAMASKYRNDCKKPGGTMPVYGDEPRGSSSWRFGPCSANSFQHRWPAGAVAHGRRDGQPSPP